MPKRTIADAIPTKLDENNSDKVIGIFHNLQAKETDIRCSAKYPCNCKRYQ
jgi:hypothetical protein